MNKEIQKHFPTIAYKLGNTYIVSSHAFTRFVHSAIEQKLFNKSDSLGDLSGAFLKYFKNSLQYNRRNSTQQVIRHKFKQASYFIYNNFVFITSENNTILTCYHISDDQFKFTYQRK